MKTVIVSVVAPARGCPPSRYRFSWTPPAEDFRPAEQWRAKVVDVPDSLGEVDVQHAVQSVLNRGGGFSLPIRFAELEKALAMIDMQLNY